MDKNLIYIIRISMKIILHSFASFTSSTSKEEEVKVIPFGGGRMFAKRTEVPRLYSGPSGEEYSRTTFIIYLVHVLQFVNSPGINLPSCIILVDVA